MGVLAFLLFLYSYSVRGLIYHSDKIAFGTLLLGLVFFLPSFRKTSISVCDVIWILAMFLITFRNQDLAHKNYYAYLETIICVVLVLILSRCWGWHNSFIKITLFFGFIHMIMGFVFYFVPDFYLSKVVPLMGLEGYWLNRIRLMVRSGFMVGFTTHHSTLGIYFSILTMMLLSMRFIKKDKKGKMKTDIAIAIAIFAFFLNGKRGPLVFAIVSATVAYFLCIYKGSISGFVRFVIFICAMCVLLIVLSRSVPAVSNFFARFIGSRNFNELSNGRLTDLWFPAIRIFLQSPIIGIGWRGFIYSFHSYSSMVQDNNVHNIYLQLLCETGVLGTTFFIFIFGFTFFKTICILRNRLDSTIQDDQERIMIVFSIMVQTFFLLEGLVGNTLYGLTFFIYCFSVAFIYSIISGRAKHNTLGG